MNYPCNTVVAACWIFSGLKSIKSLYSGYTHFYPNAVESCSSFFITSFNHSSFLDGKHLNSGIKDMSLFSKFTKQSDKVAYPWSQRKCSGPAFPRYGHVVQPVGSGDTFVVIGGIAKGSGKKDIFMFDPGNIHSCCLSQSTAPSFVIMSMAHFPSVATGSTSSYSTSGDYPPARSYHTAVSFANQVLRKLY